MRCGAAARQSGGWRFQGVCQPTPLAHPLSRRWRCEAGRANHRPIHQAARAARPFRKSPHKPPGSGEGDLWGDKPRNGLEAAARMRAAFYPTHPNPAREGRAFATPRPPRRERGSPNERMGFTPLVC